MKTAILNTLSFRNLTRCKQTDSNYESSQKNSSKTCFFLQTLLLQNHVFRKRTEMPALTILWSKNTQKIDFLKAIIPKNFDLLRKTFLQNLMLYKSFDSISDEW